MEYVYAALLLHKAGKEINEENMKKVISAAGIEPDEGRIKAIVAALEGKNIDEIIANAVVAAPAAAAPAAQGAAPAEEKKEEPKEEKKEEEAAAGLGALFG
jgi:large subunit ribosomal protein L12